VFFITKEKKLPSYDNQSNTGAKETLILNMKEINMIDEMFFL